MSLCNKKLLLHKNNKSYVVDISDHSEPIEFYSKFASKFIDVSENTPGSYTISISNTDPIMCKNYTKIQYHVYKK